jgi:hypothetical protein
MLYALPRRLSGCAPPLAARLAAARAARAPPPHGHAAQLSVTAAAQRVAMPPLGDPSKTNSVLIEDMQCMRAAVLNRPQALNAVDATMVERLTELYAKCATRGRGCACSRSAFVCASPNAAAACAARWEAQPHVGAIVLKGAGGRAFCAGGDVRALATAGGDPAARTAAAIAYFRGEDSLVYRIATLSKPHVAIMDGIVMVRARMRDTRAVRSLR